MLRRTRTDTQFLHSIGIVPAKIEKLDIPLDEQQLKLLVKTQKIKENCHCFLCTVLGRNVH